MKTKNAAAKKPVKLIPPDLKRCQAEWKEGSAFSFGIPSWRRCDNAPDFVAHEKKVTHEDGQKGSMSVCAEHRAVMEERMPGAARFVAIKSAERRKK